MHRGNVAGDGTKANFHLFKLGWRERVRKNARESFDALKMIITISKSASEENVLPWLCPHPLFLCPLPLNTTAQWLPPWTRWALCPWREGEGRWRVCKLWHFGAPMSYPPNKQKDDEARYSARLNNFCGRDLFWDDLADRQCTKPRWNTNLDKRFRDSSSSLLRINMNQHCRFRHMRFVPFFFSVDGGKNRPILFHQASLMHIRSRNEGHYITAAFKMM